VTDVTWQLIHAVRGPMVGGGRASREPRRSQGGSPELAYIYIYDKFLPTSEKKGPEFGE
jgi:hypothetical protein